MIAFTLAQLAAFAPCEVLAGNAVKLPVEQVTITHVSTSSQEIGENCLFIPLKGERFDAHKFIADALSRGAVACATHLSEEEILALLSPEEQERYHKWREQAYLLKCTDTLRLLGRCGELVRNQSPALIGAITGSCGKTSAKEMTAAILSHCGSTLYTAGNFNNDVGVPLTLLRLDEKQPFAIIEQGASHLQDIARTAEFVAADYALITNVGEAHILGFGSREGVYKGKSEILDHLFTLHPVDKSEQSPTAALKREVGFGIVPADSLWWPRWQEDYAEAVQHGKLLSFGESEQATMQVSHIVEQGEKLSFHLHCHDERFPLDGDFCLQMLGRHNALNAAGAALLSLVMGANAEAVQLGLNSSQLISGRLTPEHYGQLTVIDDAYNASFNAVLAAVDTLSKQQGVRILVLGDMGELGDAEIELHEQVGAYAAGKIDWLVCIGPLSQYCVEAMGHKACHFLKHEDLLAVLEAHVSECLDAGKEVCCLVKGSHAMHMEKVVSALQELGKKRLASEAASK